MELHQLVTLFQWLRSIKDLENHHSRELDGGATRGLLATDHVILNHGQVTWTTPELAPPSPNYHTTPHQREDVSALDRFNVHRLVWVGGGGKEVGPWKTGTNDEWEFLWLEWMIPIGLKEKIA
ncbi:uncharacterized protein TNCV_4429521 [Trichonephila clavipes]|nr:uncharacterized protein TNCV_4429521 [Trichonephila clavipes]